MIARTRRQARAVLRVSLCLPMLVGCATSSGELEESSCERIKGSPRLEAELFFGRDIAGRGTVSAAQWSDFLRDEVTPRFPEGLTQLTALGQWRDPDSGRITQEPSFIVRLITADEPQTLAQLAQIRAAYIGRFHQQSVGLTLSSICASF